MTTTECGMSTPKKKRKDYWPVVVDIQPPYEGIAQAERDARHRAAVAVVAAMEKIGKTVHVEIASYNNSALVFKARRL